MTYKDIKKYCITVCVACASVAFVLGIAMIWEVVNHNNPLVWKLAMTLSLTASCAMLVLAINERFDEWTPEEISDSGRKLNLICRRICMGSVIAGFITSLAMIWGSIDKNVFQKVIESVLFLLGTGAVVGMVSDRFRQKQGK